MKKKEKEESGWILDEVFHVDLNMAQYTPLTGSSYIPLPKKLIIKNAILNINNLDNKYFVWPVTASLQVVIPSPILLFWMLMIINSI